MTEAQAKKRIAELSKEIDDHNYKYYVLDSPSISDFKFDKLLEELIVEVEHSAARIPEQVLDAFFLQAPHHDLCTVKFFFACVLPVFGENFRAIRLSACRKAETARTSCTMSSIKVWWSADWCSTARTMRAGPAVLHRSLPATL